MCTVGAGAHSRVKMILTVYLHFLTPTLVKLAGPARAWSLSEPTDWLAKCGF